MLYSNFKNTKRVIFINILYRHNVYVYHMHGLSLYHVQIQLSYPLNQPPRRLRDELNTVTVKQQVSIELDDKLELWPLNSCSMQEDWAVFRNTVHLICSVVLVSYDALLSRLI